MLVTTSMQPVAETQTIGSSAAIKTSLIVMMLPHPAQARCPGLSGIVFFESSFRLIAMSVPVRGPEGPPTPSPRDAPGRRR